MYCGDETGAFIGDVGCHNSRFGYGGEDNPKHIVPSYVCGKDSSKRSIPTSCYSYRDDLKSIYRMETSNTVDPLEFLKQGDLIEDWDAYEEMWQSSFDVLRVRQTLKHTKGGGAFPRKKTKLDDGTTSETLTPAPTETRNMHPVLATSPGMTHVVGRKDKSIHRQQLEKHTEILMEGLNSNAVFIAPTPMLAAFGHGRQTCVVVDVGASGTRVTPVVDGLLLKNAQRRTGRGGDWLGNVTLKALGGVKPRYQIRKKNTTIENPDPLFDRWALRDVMFEFRTSEHIELATHRTSDYTTPFQENNNSMDVSSSGSGTEEYELPDGTMVNLSEKPDLKRIPELLFTDDIPFMTTPADKNLEHPTLVSNLPIHELVKDSISAVGDTDVRKELCGNIVLCGASSQFSEMGQRLSYEMSSIVTGNYKTKVIHSKYSAERSFASWIGASVLTSLGSFQQLWLSKAEYEEYGASLAIQRFP